MAFHNRKIALMGSLLSVSSLAILNGKLHATASQTEVMKMRCSSRGFNVSRTRWITWVPLIILITALGMTKAFGQSQPPHLNVPYQCANGITYTILTCKPYRADQWCQWKEEQNGNLVMSVNSTWSSMTGRLQGCAVEAAATPNSGALTAAPSRPPSDLELNTPYQCAGGLTLTVFECQGQGSQVYCQVRAETGGKLIAQVPKLRSETAAQMRACKAGAPFNPPHAAEFPSANRVVAGTLAGNPRRSVVRAMGAFYQLSEILNVLAFPRTTNGQLLPDEKKLLEDYSRASGALVQAAAQNFPGEHFELSTNPFHFARTDPKFGFDGIPVWTTFLSPGIQSAFARAVGGNAPRYLAAVDQQKRVAMQQLQADAAVQARAQQEQTMSKDKGAVTIRHCLESGRSELECLGDGMKVGLSELAGGALPASNGLPAGLRLTGLYAAGNFGVRFAQDGVTLGCGTLVPQGLNYSVERNGTRIVVSIPVAPRPISLVWQPDGRLVGPASAEISGRVVAGGTVATTSTSYEAQTRTTTTQSSIDVADIPNYAIGEVHQNGMEYSVDSQSTSTTMVPTHTTQYSVPTVPKTESCAIGALPVAAKNVSTSALLTNLLGSAGSKSSSLEPGLRLNGTYAAPGGLKIEFRDDSATLACGEAFISEAYAVNSDHGELRVKFQHATGPLALVLQPDGALSGAGSAKVQGRKIYKSAEGNIAYTPLSAECTLGKLAPVK